MNVRSQYRYNSQACYSDKQYEETFSPVTIMDHQQSIWICRSISVCISIILINSIGISMSVLVLHQVIKNIFNSQLWTMSYSIDYSINHQSDFLIKILGMEFQKCKALLAGVNLSEVSHLVIEKCVNNIIVQHSLYLIRQLLYHTMIEKPRPNNF